MIEKLIVFCTTNVQYTAYDINNPFNNVISKLKKPLTKQIMEKKKKVEMTRTFDGNGPFFPLPLLLNTPQLRNDLLSLGVISSEKLFT